jgi:hypothetical protein
LLLIDLILYYINRLLGGDFIGLTARRVFFVSWSMSLVLF